MKYRIAIIVMILSLIGIVFAESDSMLFFYTELDWYSKQAAEETNIPNGLTEREEEIYRAAYANGHYDALHPAFVEGMYVLNTKTKQFHLSNCMTTLLIDTKKRAHSFLSPEELMDQGFKPCGQCNPER